MHEKGVIVYRSVDNNVVITCRSSKKRDVTLSIIKAEYVALTEAAKEVVWLIHIIKRGGGIKSFSI